MLVKVFLSLLGFALKLNELQCFPPLVELMPATICNGLKRWKWEMVPFKTLKLAA